MADISLDDQIKSVGREIGLRRAVYPRFVANKKLTQEKADHELACMEACYATLKALKYHFEQVTQAARTKPEENAMKLPQWKCHKVVQAAHIVDMHGNGDGTHTLVLLDETGATFTREVPAAYMSKHAPNVGGYFVVYEDGYESYSPAKAFEAGYTLIPQEAT